VLDARAAPGSHAARRPGEPAAIPDPFPRTALSHYEERLQRDLNWIQDLVGIIGQAISKAIDDAATSVLRVDKDLAAATVLGDYTINRQTRELDRLCHAFVARHLPSAGHLRYVSAVLRLNIALERIGDYAATISRTAAQLTAQPPAVVARDIEMMNEQARRMLVDGMRSFQQKDVAVANATLASAAQFARYFDKVFADLVKEGETDSRPVSELFSLMATLNRLERVIHQAKNICEETIFVATGKTKGEKTFQILFVDGKNDGLSQLAVGVDLQKAWPTPLASLHPQLDEYQVVVGFGKEARDKVGTVPFHTTMVVWDVPPGEPEARYRNLTPRVRELLEKLRGEQAS
jgi:phosphate transport system protein